MAGSPTSDQPRGRRRAFRLEPGRHPLGVHHGERGEKDLGDVHPRDTVAGTDPDHEQEGQGGGEVAEEGEDPAAQVHGADEVLVRGDPAGSLGDPGDEADMGREGEVDDGVAGVGDAEACLLYTSDAADE